MSYYLKPPRGEIQREKLLNLSEKRIKFLAKLRSENDESFDQILSESLEEIEAVQDRTAKDRISHFALKLASSFCSNFRDFFVRSESKLFEMRLRNQDNNLRLQNLQVSSTKSS